MCYNKNKKKRGDDLKITSRIIADVNPEIKQKLKELSLQKDESMAKILSELIEKEHKKIIKK